VSGASDVDDVDNDDDDDDYDDFKDGKGTKDETWSGDGGDGGTAAGRVWADALRQLGTAERRVLARYALHRAPSSSSASPSAGGGGEPATAAEAAFDAELAAIEQGARAAQAAASARRWTAAWRGRRVAVGERAGALLRWLARFRAAGDVIANVDPIHVGLPWVGVRLLIELALANHALLANLVVGLETALYAATRVRAYVRFAGSLPPGDAEQRALERSTARLLGLVLRFLAGAVAAYERRALARALSSLWAGGDIQRFESDCVKAEMRVEADARACDRVLAASDGRGLQDALLELQRELGELRELRDTLAMIDSRLAMLWTSVMEEKQADILAWLSNIPYATDHATACKDRTEGTCEWIFLTEKFQRWDQSEDSMLLWLHGIRTYLIHINDG
jgi:hypothetical protein